MNEQQIRALIGDFYVAVDRGERKKAHRIAGVLARETEGVENVRWRKWTQATRRGHRAVVKTHAVETYTDGEVDALNEARGFLGDDRRVEEAVQQLQGDG